MRPFKEQWASVPATRKREFKLACMCLLIGGAWVLGKATQPPPAPPVVVEPGYFVCMTGMGQPSAMFPDVISATGRESDGLIHWSLVIKDYGEMVFIQSPGEACKVKPIVPPKAQQQQARAVAPKVPRFNL